MYDALAGMHSEMERSRPAMFINKWFVYDMIEDTDRQW